MTFDPAIFGPPRKKKDTCPFVASPARPGPRLGGAFPVTSGLVSQPLEIWVPKPFCGLFQVIRDSRTKESSAGLPFSEQVDK